jgi:hypothetical protein
MASGGKRAGAGRPKGSEDRADVARQWATKIWKDQDWDGVLQEIRESNDLAAKSRVVLKLWEYMHGKPVQPLSGEQGGPVAVTLVSHIERPKR